MRMKIFICFIIVCSSISSTFANIDLASGMMRGTFKIEGRDSVGTAFIVGRPRNNDPNSALRILVTAAHVLEKVKGEKAFLHCRKKDGVKYKRIKIPISIRKDKKPLWMKHPEADVAVMYLPLPPKMRLDTYLIGTGVFIDDSLIEKYEIHPGDTLFALGYPYGMEANTAGFPILRAGAIASYPITRSEGGNTFLFDFVVHPGNSGGPVFLIEENPIYGGKIKLGGYKGLIGIVSEGKSVYKKVSSLTETTTEKLSLDVAVVIHASVIKEAIYMLPDLEEKEKKNSRQKSAPAEQPEQSVN